MDDPITNETLMRFLDGELPPEERRRVEEALEHSTELRRELSIFQAMHEDLSGIRLTGQRMNRSVWDTVNSRLTRPMGWVFFNTGIAVWTIYAIYLYVTSPAPPFEKFTAAAVVIGLLLLFASVIHDRYREILTDPYRHVQR